MPTAVEPRFKKRIPCHLEVAGGRYSGMVLNLSRQGLFVQTTAAAQPGQPIALNLNLGGEAMPVRAAVRWKRIVAPHLRTVETGGMGLRIQDAPESYYRFLSKVADGPGGTQPLVSAAPATGGTHSLVSASPAPVEPVASPALDFKVRVKQLSGPRSRTLRVRAANAETARSQALAKAGAGWQVLQIEELEGQS